MERLEVRLDREHRRRLEEVARYRGSNISEAVRRMIDRAYEQELMKERRRAVERLSGLEVEDVPDPDVLTKQLEGAHESPRLY